MYSKSLRLYAIAAFGLATFLPISTAIAGSTDSELRVIQSVRRVTLAKGANEQVAAAEALRDLILAIDPSAIGDGTIHTVASLLEIRNDGLRYWVAEALGHFGPRARFAAPKLLAILTQEECAVAETSSTSMIRDSLERIGKPASPRKCDYYALPK